MLRAASRAMWRAQTQWAARAPSSSVAGQAGARSSVCSSSLHHHGSRVLVASHQLQQQQRACTLTVIAAAAAASSSSRSSGGGLAAGALPTSSSSSGAAAGAGQQEQQARIAQLLGLKLPDYCCGCGVKLQQTDPDGPGYFQIPRRLLDMAEEQADLLQGGSSGNSSSSSPQQQQGASGGVSAEERERRALDAAMEAWLDEQQRPAVPQLGGKAGELGGGSEGGSSSAARQAAIKCARCYSLVHYGKIKSQLAEAALPEFDLGRKVGRKIALQRDRRATVLCVVDCADFDGSLPRAALSSLFPGISPDTPLPSNPDDLPFTLAVAVNKFDLLPTQATPQRVQQWVRARLKQAGLPRPSRVFMVSALNGLGVAAMVAALRDDMGFRADLWVVGAQNAGKSSLISAMRRIGGGAAGATVAGLAGSGFDPTIAPIPGTTLGLLRVPGVPLGPKHRTFDTPGVPHPYQLTSRLDLQELGAVLPRRRLKPRTYVLPIGHSLLLGGLARVDAVAGPSANLYVTVFVSDEVVTHMGKTEGVDERRERHVGGRLSPPFTAERLRELRLVPRVAVVEGDSWRQHCRDIAIAGLGWVSVGVSGSAELKVWVPEGVMVTLHDALIPDFAKVFQKPGFSKLLPGPLLARQGEQAQAQQAAKQPGSSKRQRGGSKPRSQDSLRYADDSDDEDA